MYEIAGLIQVKIAQGEKSANEWLEKHSDTEVVDIKISSNENSILIIYRKDI